MNDCDWLLDSYRQWKHLVSVCIVEDDCNCWCVLHDRTIGTIWQHFRVVGLSKSFYIEKSHSACWRNDVSESERGTRFCRIKESFVMELNPSRTTMCRMVDLSDKRCPAPSTVLPKYAHKTKKKHISKITS